MMKICGFCSKEFSVPKCRENTAKYCSRSCSDKAPRVKNSTNCSECGKLFHIKKSQAERSKYWGSFCSRLCISSFQSRIRTGEKNPNFKNRSYCQDGYRIYTPQASMSMGFGRIKLHHAVVFSYLGLKALPVGYHVHHKDCDVENNTESNLQLISVSDHKWIHKEFGSATLWAFEMGKIELHDILSWTSDKVRAKFILLSNIINQRDMLIDCNIEDVNNINERLTMNKQYFDTLSDSERGNGGFGSSGV